MKEILPYQEEFDGMRLNDGSQVDAYLCDSDIVIYVGNRGVGKTFLMLMRELPHIGKSYYRSIFFRKMVRDAQTAGGIADRSTEIFGQFGVYKSSLQYTTWSFDSGAKAVFANYSASQDDFAEAIQGIEYYRANIDEVTQISEDRFNAIYSNLRNTKGEKTQMFGTCNADPDSWIVNLIHMYIDEETGYHIPEMNGVETYFYQYGDNITESFFGLSKASVMAHAEPYIDEMWEEEMGEYGTKFDLIQSLTVYEGKMHENTHLMKSGGVEYYGKLLTGSLEMKGRYAKACWKNHDTSEGLISDEDMKRMFNTAPQTSGTRYATMDVSGLGKDNAVVWIWDGFHIENMYTTKGKTAKSLTDWVARILSRERVQYENFAFDAIGVGYAFTGYFEGAMGFVSNAKPSDESKVKFDGRELSVYKDMKAQVVGLFVDKLQNNEDSGECGISISEDVILKNINGRTVADILNEERKVIKWRSDVDGVKQVITRKETKRLLKRSPDFILSIIYRMSLDMKKKSKLTDKNAKKIVRGLAMALMS